MEETPGAQGAEIQLEEGLTPGCTLWESMDAEGSGSDHSVIGRGAMIEGTFSSTGSLGIEGQLKGDISVEGEVRLSAEAIVEADVRAGSIILGGRLRGNLTAPGEVSLPPESVVEGNVSGRSVRAEGRIRGDVAAQDRVELGPGARVEGDITCNTMVVAEGAVFHGRSLMGEASDHLPPQA
jgi:cytoskeletal protein CcmA (bactofilin family)